MALLSVSKVRLFVHKEKESAVFSFLQNTGAFEPVKTAEREGVSYDAEEARASIDFAIKFLSSFVKEGKKTMREKVLGEKIEKTEDEIAGVISSFSWREVVEALEDLEAEKNDFVRHIADKKLEIVALEDFAGQKVQKIVSDRFASFLCRVPLSSLENFSFSLEKSVALSGMQILGKTASTALCVVVAEKEKISDIKGLLVSVKGEEAIFDFEGDVSAVLEKKKQELLALEQKQSANLESIVGLTENIDKLKIVYDHFASAEVVENVKRGALATSSVVVMEGWVLQSEVENLKKTLTEKFADVELEEMKVKEGEIERVAYKLSSFAEPVLGITQMYGTPTAQEIDPTPYYAIFYIVFFGFCLTDAGYGIILSGLTGLLIYSNLPFTAGVRNFLKLFFFGGLSTIVLGAMFGGWFGLTVAQVPEFLTYTTDTGKQMFLGQVFDPMSDLVTKIMPLTYLLGLLHLSLGLFLSGKISWNAGSKTRMFFVVFPLYAVFIGLGLWKGLGIGVAEYVVYAALLVSLWGFGEGSKNPVLRMLKGLGGLLNEILAWFSNLLSYSRLFALGLATGIIAAAFNTVALTFFSLLGGGILGFVVLVITLLFGHSLNIALNLLGAYVHSARLQFVEFFGMFLSGGGGKEFQPLKKVHRFLFLPS